MAHQRCYPRQTQSLALTVGEDGNGDACPAWLMRESKDMDYEKPSSLSVLLYIMIIGETPSTLIGPVNPSRVRSSFSSVLSGAHIVPAQGVCSSNIELVVSILFTLILVSTLKSAVCRFYTALALLRIFI